LPTPEPVREPEKPFNVLKHLRQQKIPRSYGLAFLSGNYAVGLSHSEILFLLLAAVDAA
jgi:hypothetical protein